ncbi:MAG: Ig-like domain-containing protein [Bacillota bacterium]|nr:Ig-like domain-containing protein [Bacillota bacterium]
MTKTRLAIRTLLLFSFLALLAACGKATTLPTTTSTPEITTVYDAEDIADFGSGTPAGTAFYQVDDDTAVIWNVDASLDNYGGVQTPTIRLDFSKAVGFRMEVVDCYSQYIVKLAVEGESEYYYVLSDSGASGVISINVVDAMLSTKYQTKNTQPDPGYASGWKYDGQIKNCSFHILAKGPDGEKQTAELVLKSVSVTNDTEAVTGLTILSDAISGNAITRLKGSSAVQVAATIAPLSIGDQAVLWTSLDPSVATVSADGTVAFVGVGVTSIVATAAIDQSKSASLTVNVTSGYEDPAALATRLTQLAFDGTTTDAQAFEDLFKTTWTGSTGQAFTLASAPFLAVRATEHFAVVENYFNPSSPSDVNFAAQALAGGTSKIGITLEGTGGATVYRMIDGKLYSERYAASFGAVYAEHAAAWSKTASYEENTIVVWDDGSVRKYGLSILATTLIGSYGASDLADPVQWRIPDRALQVEDPVVNALSPASVSTDGDRAVIRQDKYPEAKYCFGGIVSDILAAPAGKDVELILDVASLNRMNDYVKTMWEVKVLYYQALDGAVVSANPIKIASGNTTGVQTIAFTPAYRFFRIYLVVNGSDIGAQFAEATMQIRSLKLYSLD